MHPSRFAFIVHHTSHTLFTRPNQPQLSHKRMRPCTTRRLHLTKASTTPTPHSRPPGQNPQDHTHKTKPPRATSKTVVGKVLVEFFSLLFGALLLLLVVMWRFSQFLTLKFLRVVTWLSDVRRLGKWAFLKIRPVDRIALPVASFAHALRRGLGLVLGRDGSHPGSVSARVTDVRADAPRTRVDVYDEDDRYAGRSAHVRDARENAGGKRPARRQTGRRLILMRDAKARWDREVHAPDHDRVLSERGVAEAEVIGRELGRLEWLPDVVVCSDAVRTIQTLDELKLPSGRGTSVLKTEALYYAVTGDDMALAVDDLLDGIGFGDDCTVMVVCHNPGCEELCEHVCGERPELGTACTVLLKYEDPRDVFSWRGSTSLKLATQSTNWSIQQLLRPLALSDGGFMADA